MKSICLQAGHQFIQANCITALRTSTGAPGEVEFTVRTRDRLSNILLSKKNFDGTQAFTIQLVDANYNCNPEAGQKTFDLFLAIHYDADVYKPPKPRDGGFVDVPDPDLDDVNVESKRIRDAMVSEYFKHSNIANRPERSNPNTRRFYMWQYLTSKTPCVIIECGVGQDPHDKIILADPNIVANSIARGICKAFNIPFDPVQPQPDYKKALVDVKAKVGEIQKILSSVGI